MRYNYTKIFNLLILCLFIYGCSSGNSGESGGDRTFAGGETTFDDRSETALENPAPNLTPIELSKHELGDAIFSARFFGAQGLSNSGLGPQFNNASCVLCHTGNGRGEPEFVTGPAASQAVLSISTISRNLPRGPQGVSGLGTQIQDNANEGVQPEARIQLRWQEVGGTYADGSGYSLRRPVVSVTLSNGSELPQGTHTSMRTGPGVFGLGLLEAIPEESILALADPDDQDKDGISGRPNYVWDVESSSRRLGRFGRKANQPTLRQQVAAAFFQDMGLTNPLFGSDGGEPEIDLNSISSVVFYLQTLAVPRAETLHTEGILRGENLFSDFGCSACHIQSLQTGDHPVSAISNQTIYPYTDMLLHDMGSELADNRSDFEASGREWRTAPLWGIGIARKILPGRDTYLHDGRARSIEEAILWHGGEAAASKERFKTASEADRAALLEFLRSL